MVKHRQIPFIALTETWLKPYIHDSQVNIEGYLVSRSDRGTRKRVGTVEKKTRYIIIGRTLKITVIK